MDRDRDMILSTPDDGALEPKLKVRRWLETNLLSMRPWSIWISMALQGTDKELLSERPRQQ